MKFSLSLLTIVLLLPLNLFAQADVYLGISSGKNDRSKIRVGLVPFCPSLKGDLKDAQLAKKVQAIIRSDLLFSRYFEFSQDGPAISQCEPDPKKHAGFFNQWRKLGVQYVLLGKVDSQDEGWLSGTQIYDPYTGKLVFEKYYKGQSESLRRGTHFLSDAIVRKLTGKRGISHTRIAFSNNNTGHKEIYMVDYDGKDLTKLTNHNSLSLLPRWSADSSMIYYLSYRDDSTDMFTIDLKSREIKPFSQIPGLNIPGGVSPDGKEMVLTMSRGENPHIYLMNLETKKLRQLTARYGVESSATYSPDGKYVSYISNISGNPQVYTMELETGRQKRLTRMNWCDSPKWSPSGEWIVFAGRIYPSDPIDIYLVDITGSQRRQLTSNEGDNEDPSWSPDGRFISFTSTRNKKREIYVMDADGSAPHLVADIEGDSFTPDWSN
jgi:TolB protein